MDGSQLCRENAARYVIEAEQCADLIMKAQFLDIAQAWLRIGERAKMLREFNKNLSLPSLRTKILNRASPGPNNSTSNSHV